VPKAELVFANVVDVRSWEAEGQGATPLVYTISIPGRALPFVVVRYWKAPQGYVAERVELIAPSGKTAYRSEEHVRRMTGQMDLTPIADVVEDALFEEAGVYAASFLIDGEVQGQVEFQLMLAAPGAVPAALYHRRPGPRARGTAHGAGAPCAGAVVGGATGAVAGGALDCHGHARGVV